MNRFLRWGPWLLLPLLLDACVVQQAPQPNDPYYAPVLESRAPMPAASEGSLYRGDYSLSFFDDRKATRVGDIITILLSERTVSRKASGVSITKENELTAEGTLLGKTPTLRDLTLSNDFKTENDFEGKSGADQSNSLQGSITVTVTDILPNGNLVVRGEKWITLNRGEEFIRISGIVRREDIGLDNSVRSTRVANARISYAGTGELADANTQGWLGQFFNSPLWPL